MDPLIHSLPLPGPMPHQPAAFDLPAMGGGDRGPLRFFSIPWVPMPAPGMRVSRPIEPYRWLGSKCALDCTGCGGRGCRLSDHQEP